MEEQGKITVDARFLKEILAAARSIDEWLCASGLDNETRVSRAKVEVNRLIKKMKSTSH